MHLPSLVHIVGIGSLFSFGDGGYNLVALVSRSLKLGSVLNPTMGLSLNKRPQSGLFVIMFQLLWMISLVLGLHGL